jgi:hypothetical protein
MDVVHDAKRLSDQGKYDAAHQRLAQLAPGSDARQSTEFKDVEFKWASETLLLADRTPDPAAKRALLEVVAQSSTADDTLRSSAKDRLAALDSAGVDAGVTKVKVASLRGMGKSEGAVIITNQQQPPDPPTPPVGTFAPPPPPPPSATPPPTRSVQELANSTASADWWTARRILEPKVTGGTATVDEVHLLMQVCKLQKDKPCIKQCARTLAGKH